MSNVPSRIIPLSVCAALFACTPAAVDPIDPIGEDACVESLADLPRPKTANPSVPLDDTALCCEDGDWTQSACLGQASFVGTVGDANRCVERAGTLLSCMDSNGPTSWNCVPAGDDGRTYCQCGRLPSSATTDGYTWSVHRRGATGDIQPSRAVRQAACCEEIDPDTGTCTFVGDRQELDEKAERPRGLVPPELHGARPVACEVSGGKWADCRADAWSCRRDRDPLSATRVEEYACRCEP